MVKNLEALLVPGRKDFHGRALLDCAGEVEGLIIDEGSDGLTNQSGRDISRNLSRRHSFWIDLGRPIGQCDRDFSFAHNKKASALTHQGWARTDKSAERGRRGRI